MLDIVNLIADHDALDAMANGLISAARVDAASPAACRAAMEKLGARLDRHLRDEDAYLRDEPSGQRHAAFHRALAAFDGEFGELFDGWEDYLAHWDEAQIASARKSYAGETADIMTVFKLRLARENDALYPLALEASLAIAG